jgi:hypothetical protein
MCAKQSEWPETEYATHMVYGPRTTIRKTQCKLVGVIYITKNIMKNTKKVQENVLRITR